MVTKGLLWYGIKTDCRRIYPRCNYPVPLLHILRDYIYPWYPARGNQILAGPMSATVSDELLFGSSYHNAFDPVAYLKPRYSGDTTDVVHCVFPLQQLHKFWASYPADRNDLKVLEFGTAWSLFTVGDQFCTVCFRDSAG